MNTAEGYISKLALDENKEIIGFEYINTSRLINALQKGISGTDALKQATSHYGRYDDAVSYIDPRE